MIQAPQDLFAEAREKFKIADAWHLLGFDGAPKASCKSPFREDRHPSFSIHSEGCAWTDHATGDGGDVIEFIRHAIGGDYKDVREWLRERIGTPKAPSKPVKAPQAPKRIVWPAGMIDATCELWKQFYESRRITIPAARAMIETGIVRLAKIDGEKCYIVTDKSYRAAEIRRIDRNPFGESKVYRLPGVDKSWLPGLELLRQTSGSTAVLITEGATDLISAIDIYARYRRSGGKHSWQPVALLGAGCKNIHPEAAALIKGRHVRIVPDADTAGDVMAEHWSGLLRKIGCPVDVVTLPQGTDLTDNLSTLSPTDLFSL